MIIFTLFAFSFSNADSPAQNFIQKTSFDIGSAIYGPNRKNQPGSVSLGLQASLHLKTHLSIDFRYENNLFTVGHTGKNHRNTSTYNRNSPLSRGIQSWSLTPTFHFDFFKTRVYTGLGLAFFQRNPREYVSFNSFNNLAKNREFTTLSRSYGTSLKAGTNIGKLFSGFMVNASFNKEIAESLSIFLYYRFLENTLKKRTKRKSQKKLHDISIELGVQPLGNLTKYAGTFNFYMEPKIKVKDNLTIGYRINTYRPIPLGYDEESILYYRSDFLGTISQTYWNTNQLAETQSKSITAQYYFKQSSGWYFINAGIGTFNRKEMSASDVFNDPVLNSVPLIIEHQRNIGYHIGIGWKVGFYRFSLDYNFTGKKIPNYLSLQMGIEAGLFWNKKQSKN